MGPAYFYGCLKFLSLMGFFICYLGNQDCKATFMFKWKQTTGGSTFPLAWSTLIPFMLSAILNMYSFLHLGVLVFQGPLAFINSILPPFLIALGGVIEGLFAETIFDQKIHAFAVILFNAGFWLELNMIEKGGELLSWNDK